MRNSDLAELVSPQEFCGAPLLREKQAIERMGVSPATARRWRKEGGGPPFTKLNKKLIRYPADKLEAWLQAQTSDQNPEKKRKRR